MEKMKSIFETMYRIRQFENKVSEIYADKSNAKFTGYTKLEAEKPQACEDNKIPGFVHLYIGEEAIAAGVCANLRKEDTITSTHRGHGHLIAKGGRTKYMMAELFGKSTGYCKGKGGSMHIADVELGIIGANGIVGGGLPLAAGSAYAHKLMGKGNVAVAMFGDGSTNEGTFHEAMNVASAWNLPLVFVCENNNYGVSTQISRVSNLPNISSRAAAYGMRACVADGNDFMEVYEAAKKAVEAARAGFGPTLIECRTFRQHGHFEGEEVTYWQKNERENWLREDPMLKAEDTLLAAGVTDREIAAIKAKVDDEIREAVEFAENSPFPRPEDAVTDLYYTEEA